MVIRGSLLFDSFHYGNNYTINRIDSTKVSFYNEGRKRGEKVSFGTSLK